MTQSGKFSTEEIQKVESGKLGSKRRGDKSKQFEWKEDDSLPVGWKRKKTGTGKFKRFTYLSDKNQIFPSRLSVIEHMTKSKTFSTEDTERVKLGSKNVRRHRATSTEKNLISNGNLEPYKNKKYDWKDDLTLPEGWKKSSSIQKSSGKLHNYFYLKISPNEDKTFPKKLTI